MDLINCSKFYCLFLINNTLPIIKRIAVVITFMFHIFFRNIENFFSQLTIYFINIFYYKSNDNKNLIAVVREISQQSLDQPGLGV
jgi:hypothetical protein